MLSAFYLSGDAQFISATYRLFKLPEEKKKACQLIYKGEIPNFEEMLKFDHTVNMKVHIHMFRLF